MEKKLIWILSGLYLFSRVIFITTQPVFFDSAEYLSRFQQKEYSQSLLLGHIPLHAGYPLLLWPVFHTAETLHQNPAWWLIMAQIILSLATLRLFYEVIKILTKNTRVAATTVCLFALTPLYWISSITIMMEAVYIFCFAAACYGVARYSLSKTMLNRWAIILFLFLSLSILTHPLVIIWLPFLGSMSFVLNRQKFLQVIVILGLSWLVATVLNVFLIATQLHDTWQVGLGYLYGSKLREQSDVTFTIKGMVVNLRNFLIPLLRNNTPVVVILAMTGLLSLFRKNILLFLVCVLWITPAFIANQWWDTLFFGRHALIAGVGLAFLAAQILAQRKRTLVLVFAYLIIVSGYALSLLHQPSPYLQEAEMVQQLPAGGILVESHFARPQTQTLYRGEMIFVDEPNWGATQLTDKIHDALLHHQPIFISASALSEPYGMFSGPYVHELSLSYANPFHLQPIIENFTLVPYKSVAPQDNVMVYQVISEQRHPYPTIQNLLASWRRIDFADPFTQIWLYIHFKWWGQQ